MISKKKMSLNMKVINVGLFGHVSNGKTTVVSRLTGVDTKKSSNEIKTGRTIKLGYANCLVWRCKENNNQECNTIITTGQTCVNKNVNKSETIANTVCPVCNRGIYTPDYKISFIDAPGHHSYVHTAIKGADVINCAILVTDARANELQPQTLEHLAILEALQINNIIVLQNKIDLLKPEQCIENFVKLKEELSNTVAKNAIIVPISAQRNLGMDNAKQALYNMLEKCRKNTDIPVGGSGASSGNNFFSIIRSFDINRPGTPESNRKGGVIGGTLKGNIEYKVGDIIEIRPGNYITEIKSIFSEDNECDVMSSGGLYGIGTTLDGNITKADSLTGCVAGLVGLKGICETLPPVVDEIKMNVIYMKLGLDGLVVNKLKVGEGCSIIIGNAVVKAVVKDITKIVVKTVNNTTRFQDKNIIFSLYKPACISANIGIIYEASKGSCSRLIGYGSIETETEQEKSPREEESKEKLEEKNIEQSLTDYITILPTVEEKSRLKFPVPRLYIHNRCIIWENFSSYTTLFNRTTSEIENFFSVELQAVTAPCKDGLKISKARFTSIQFENLLRKYIVKKVLCYQCKSYNTTPEKNSARVIQLNCGSCGAIRILQD